jgi:hypothetical protein
MFLALPTQPQEVLNKWHLVYCVRAMSVGCTNPDAATDVTRMQYTKCRLCNTS